MPSPPWMPLYISDYLSDTSHLSTVEHGAYLLLIMHYWRTGKLVADEKHLSSIARLTLDKWRKISPTIQRFFEIDGECWHHGRIEKEIVAAREKYEKRKAAGRLGGIEKARKFSSNATDLPKQCSTNHNYNYSSKKEDPPLPPLRGDARKQRTKKAKTQLPEDFVLTEDRRQPTRALGWNDAQTENQFARFCDSARAHDRMYANWDAAWRNWITSSYQTINGGLPNGHRPGIQNDSRPGSAAQFARRRYEQKHGNLFGSPSSSSEERSSVVGVISQD